MPRKRKTAIEKQKTTKRLKKRNAHRNKIYCRRWRENNQRNSRDVASEFQESEDREVVNVSRKRGADGGDIPKKFKRRRYEAQRRYRAKQNIRTWESYVEKYEQEIRESCSHVCNCCGRLCYAKNISKIDRADLAKAGASDIFLNNVFAIKNNGLQKFCVTCRTNIKKRIVPRLCLNNGLHFPNVDFSVSRLNRIEERLVSPYHVFQTIWPVMGPHGQFKGKGGIVNVPINLDTTVSSLPRSKHDSHIIHVSLARKMEYLHDYMDGMVRPVKVYDAARCLVQKPLFVEHGIQLSSSWVEDNCTGEYDSTSASSDYDNQLFSHETLLIADEAVRLAPAEGYTPRSILLEPDSEYLAFPKIFGGYKLEPTYNGKPIPYSDIMKSFAMRFDRRVAARGDYLLFMAKKNELIKLNNNIGICLRKKCLNTDCSITANDMLNSAFVSGLIQHDDGFMVLRGIRNSAAHWKNEKTKLLASIRQYGLATFFITLSSADIQWPELLVQLKLTVDNETITEEETELLSYSERARLIQKDPITCALHFDNRFKALKKTWTCKDGPFGNYEIVHYYHRIEFQQRGSPHVHMIVWLKDAPKCDTNNKNKQRMACSFIDSIITCSSKNIDEKLLKLQTHKHTRTCRRKGGKKGCRFGIPYFPMKKTRILDPLDETFDEKEKSKLLTLCSKIKEFQLEEDTARLNFKTFLRRLDLSEKEYIMAVRSTLKRSQVFLRRRPSEMFINAYNPKILKLMKSNMDIQFILDPYGCAAYILNYINKSDKGMSLLMETVFKEIREGNENLRSALRKISNTHYNNSELSMQEACYNILQLNLSESSEECVFISTFPPSRRVRMVRSNQELQDLHQDSTDIFADGLLQHYQSRPIEMEEMTLADFAANYRYSTRPISSNSVSLLENKGYVTRRIKPRVIRYVGYNYETNPDDYFREMLMLYHPWRDEENDILNVDLESKFGSCEAGIAVAWSRYHALKDDVMNLAFAEAASNTNHDESFFDDNKPHFDFDLYHLNDNFVDVLNEVGDDNRTAQSNTFTSPRILPSVEYRDLLGRLNPEQRDYVSHITNHFRVSDKPIYHFLTGGAGVGKSLVISAIYQILKRIFLRDLDSSPEDTTILICSPTGKSAFEINGQTIHSAFRLPINQKELNELSADVSNTLATKLSKLKLIIIDEISMVGQGVLKMVDQRLRHLFNNRKLFGGISLLTCGDFNQLDPVFARPLYYPFSTNPYEEIFNGNIWQNFKVFQLNTIMRQSSIDFQTALNNMAKGEMTHDDVLLMRSRVFHTVPEDLRSSDALHLFARNVDVDDWNILSLKSIPGEEIICNASDIVHGHGSAASRRQIMYSAQNSQPAQTMGIPFSVTLKVGAIYMITYNVDTPDGLVNGVTGKLQLIEFGLRHNSTEDKKPLRLWIEFSNATIGAQKRRRFNGIINRLHIPSTWTPIEPIVVKVKTKKNSTLFVNRKQFPIASSRIDSP